MTAIGLAAATPLVVTLLAQAPSPPVTGAASVALTFDDLPTHGVLPPGMSRTDLAKSLIETLRAHRAPRVYGFINAKAMVERPEDGQVLRLWRDAGFPLGNHAWSHMDLAVNTAEAFQQDVVANEDTLKTLMDSEDWHWFRYPYLREGDTPEKHRAVLGFLKGRGYKVAQVTLDFNDYTYNGPYARCLAKNDTASIDWLKQSYLTRAEESLTRGQEASRALFGRDIKHVMLLHIGGFETVMLPRLLELLETRKFTLIPLDEAVSDPAYATTFALPADWNGTFLQQLARARQMPPPKTLDPDLFAKLAAMCR